MQWAFIQKMFPASAQFCSGFEWKTFSKEDDLLKEAEELLFVELTCS